MPASPAGAQDVGEQLLVLLDVDAFIGDVFAAADGHQEEDRMVHRAEFFCESRDVANLVAVSVDHGGVDLERQADAFACFDARKRGRVSAGHSAEDVVLFGVEAVNANAHGAGTRLFELACDFGRDERAVAAEHRAQAARCCVRDELENVVAHKPLAAAENHDFEASACDLRNHRARFFG